MTYQPASSLSITPHQDCLLGQAFATRRDVVSYALAAMAAVSGILAASATGHAQLSQP